MNELILLCVLLIFAYLYMRNYELSGTLTPAVIFSSNLDIIGLFERSFSKIVLNYWKQQKIENIPLIDFYVLSLLELRKLIYFIDVKHLMARIWV